MDASFSHTIKLMNKYRMDFICLENGTLNSKRL